MLRIRHLFCFLVLAAACVRGAEPATNADAAWISITNLQVALHLTNSVHLDDGLILSNALHVVHLFAGRRSITVDGVSVWLQLPPRDASTNDLRDLAAADYETLLRPILLTTSLPPAHLQIVLDAGHGGEDTGARSAAPEIREKDVTLDIVHRVSTRLTAAGESVILTRTHDVYVPLGERMRFAAAHHAQLFVSIHANSAPSNHCAMGAETYILPSPGFPGTAEMIHGLTNACPGNRYDAASALLGFAIHRNCAPQSAMDRGLKRARYFVLKEAPCPATLVECGFLTNTNDTSRLADATYRQKFADSIAAGILEYTHLAAPSAVCTAQPIIVTNEVAELTNRWVAAQSNGPSVQQPTPCDAATNPAEEHH